MKTKMDMVLDGDITEGFYFKNGYGIKPVRQPDLLREFTIGVMDFTINATNGTLDVTYVDDKKLSELIAFYNCVCEWNIFRDLLEANLISLGECRSGVDHSLQKTIKEIYRSVLHSLTDCSNEKLMKLHLDFKEYMVNNDLVADRNII